MKITIRRDVCTATLMRKQATIDTVVCTHEALTKCQSHAPLISDPPPIPLSSFTPFLNGATGTFDVVFLSPGVRLYKQGAAIPFTLSQVVITEGRNIKRVRFSGAAAPKYLEDLPADFWATQTNGTTTIAGDGLDGSPRTCHGVSTWIAAAQNNQGPGTIPCNTMPIPSVPITTPDQVQTISALRSTALWRDNDWSMARTSIDFSNAGTNPAILGIGTTVTKICTFRPANKTLLNSDSWPSTEGISPASSMSIYYEIDVADNLINSLSPGVVNDIYLVVPFEKTSVRIVTPPTNVGPIAFPDLDSLNSGPWAAFVASLNFVKNSANQTVNYAHGYFAMVAQNKRSAVAWWDDTNASTEGVWFGGQQSGAVTVSFGGIPQIRLLRPTIFDTPPPAGPYGTL